MNIKVTNQYILNTVFNVLPYVTVTFVAVISSYSYVTAYLFIRLSFNHAAIQENDNRNAFCMNIEYSYASIDKVLAEYLNFNPSIIILQSLKS